VEYLSTFNIITFVIAIAMIILDMFIFKDDE